MRIITAYRKDIEVDDDNFPAWAYRSTYAEQLWGMWCSNLSDRIEIIRCQETPALRKYLIRRCKAKVNS